MTPIVFVPSSPHGKAATTLRGLPDDVRADRERKELTPTQQAKLIGIGVDTLARVEAGGNSTRETLLACLDYLGGEQ